MAHATYAPATVRRLQWVRAWTHTAQHDQYVMSQVEEFEDIHHHNVMRIVSASAFSTPIVNQATGQRGAMQKSVAMVCSFCPGGQVADRCLYDSHPKCDNDTMMRWEYSP